MFEYEVGNIVKLKKKHPCGSFEWYIVSKGADIKLKCVGCDHIINMKRTLFDKNIKAVRKSE